MTDEEKAEEYADECFKGNDKDSQYYRTILIKGYLDGLAEGRKEGYEQGYEDCRHYAHDYYKSKWHDLRKDPNDLPKCTESEQVIFYVQEYYKAIEKYINHYCLGFYKKSFLNDDVKLFVERSKGYECEHSTEDVLCWCELPKFEE